MCLNNTTPTVRCKTLSNRKYETHARTIQKAYSISIYRVSVLCVFFLVNWITKTGCLNIYVIFRISWKGRINIKCLICNLRAHLSWSKYSFLWDKRRIQFKFNLREVIHFSIDFQFSTENFYTAALYKAMCSPYFLFISRHILFELQNSSQEIATDPQKSIASIDIYMSSISDKALTVTRVFSNTGGAYIAPFPYTLTLQELRYLMAFRFFIR